MVCFEVGSYGSWTRTVTIRSIPPADAIFPFGGVPGDIPVTGDWNGSGTTKAGVYRQATGQWLLDYNGDGVFDSGDRIYNFRRRATYP